MKKKLKKRILINISIVLILSMTISAIAGFLYFENVVRKQKIFDEKTKLKQVANQIEFIIEDIENFSKSIIGDDLLLEMIEKDNFDNEYQRYKNIDEISKRLMFFNSLRTYIGCSFLEKKDGARYASSVSTKEEDYQKRKFENLDFINYKEDQERIFSDPYIGLDTGMVQKVICFKGEMWDRYDYGNKRGELYLEIYLDYFLKGIRTYGKEYKNVWMLGDDGTFLYEQGETDFLHQFIDEGGGVNLNDTQKVTGGFLIFQKVQSANWVICTLITNEYLWAMSSFVLKFFVISLFLSLILVLLFTSRIMENMIRPITRLSEQMQQMDYNVLEIKEMVNTGDEIQTLYECFKKMLGDLKLNIKEKIRHENLKKEMEFDIMLSQIHPHYLYNVLNTVVYLAAAEKNDHIVKIVKSLIYSLQETLNLGENNIFTSIKKEVKLTECYLTIQKFRYPDNFEIEWNLDQELLDNMIPKTMIQPLVENALLHGILEGDNKGLIKVCVFKKKAGISIEVEDHGIGICDHQLRIFEERKDDVVNEKNGRKHIGISNVRDRIIYLYGSKAEMNIVRILPTGTKVSIYLPIQSEKPKEV